MADDKKGKLGYIDITDEQFDKAKSSLIYRVVIKRELNIDLMLNNNAATMVNIKDLRPKYALYWSTGAHGSDVYLVNLDDEGSWVTVGGKKLINDEEKIKALNLAAVDPTNKDALSCIVIGELKNVQIDRDTILEYLGQPIEFNSIFNYFIDPNNRGKDKVFVFTLSRSDNLLKTVSFVFTSKQSISKLTNILDRSKDIFDYFRTIYSHFGLPQSGRLFNRLTLPIYFWMFSGGTRMTVKNQMGDWNQYDEGADAESIRQITFDRYMKREFLISDDEYDNIIRDFLISLCREYYRIYDLTMGKLLRVGDVKNGVFHYKFFDDKNKVWVEKSFYILNDFKMRLRALIDTLNINLPKEDINIIVNNPDTVFRSDERHRLHYNNNDVANPDYQSHLKRFYSNTGDAYDSILSKLNENDEESFIKHFNQLTSFEERSLAFESAVKSHKKKIDDEREKLKKKRANRL